MPPGYKFHSKNPDGPYTGSKIKIMSLTLLMKREPSTQTYAFPEPGSHFFVIKVFGESPQVKSLCCAPPSNTILLDKIPSLNSFHSVNPCLNCPLHPLRYNFTLLVNHSVLSLKRRERGSDGAQTIQDMYIRNGGLWGKTQQWPVYLDELFMFIRLSTTRKMGD